MRPTEFQPEEAAIRRRAILRAGQEAGAADAGCIGKTADAAGAHGRRRIAPHAPGGMG